jgi:hypothetical protein
MTTQLLPLVEWTEGHTRRDEVVATDGDPLLYLYTGRPTIPSARWVAEAYPREVETPARAADLRALLDAYHVRYVLLGGGRSATASAAAALTEGPRRRLQMLTILPGGGAVFTTVPGASHE